ncbi:hypothetical protein [Kitasatospora herbaricolor]|uniref:Uncharacterized protein n=1 Tax=Kitasatospora herbaricolor TaxID=68217 RepID=A0ABZ1W175_9ACTN|nr:hypothetical protein [Kitasatospora herbaricolor]
MDLDGRVSAGHRVGSVSRSALISSFHHPSDRPITQAHGPGIPARREADGGAGLAVGLIGGAPGCGAPHRDPEVG